MSVAGNHRAEVLELEDLYSRGQYARAIALGERMLERPGVPRTAARIRYHVAMSFLQVGQAERGGQLLAEARSYFETARDASMLIECMAGEAALAMLTQQPNALELARKALVACRSVHPVPRALEVRILNYVAGAHLNSGQWLQAIEACEEAIERAGPLFDIRRQAKLIGDAAIAYKELGQIDTAARYAFRAVALLEVLRDSVSLARAENNLGLICLRRGERDAARSHLERALRLCVEANLEVGRSHVLLSLCELDLAEGRPRRAREHALHALRYADRLREMGSAAQAHLWLGQVAETLGEPEAADIEFEEAIGLLAAAGSQEWLLRCHHEYAEILEKRGDFPRAYQHLKLAFNLASLYMGYTGARY
jgi:tetratricopeptide (TPR) repeat protein